MCHKNDYIITIYDDDGNEENIDEVLGTASQTKYNWEPSNLKEGELLYSVVLSIDALIENLEKLEALPTDPVEDKLKCGREVVAYLKRGTSPNTPPHCSLQCFMTRPLLQTTTSPHTYLITPNDKR